MPQNVATNEATMQRGRHVAPHHGLVIPPYPPLLDGPSGQRIRCATLAEHMPHLVSGFPVPEEWMPCDETATAPATTPIIDRGLSGWSYPATGLVTYGQVVAGWTRPFITIPSATGNGFRLALAQSYDASMPVFIFFTARITATGGTRTLYTVGPNALLQIDSAGRLILFVTGSSLVTGTANHISATIARDFAIFVDPTPTADGPPIMKVWSNLEPAGLQVTAGGGPGGILTAMGDGIKGMGGAGTVPAWSITHWGICKGRTARRAANLGGVRQGGYTWLRERGYAI